MRRALALVLIFMVVPASCSTGESDDTASREPAKITASRTRVTWTGNFSMQQQRPVYRDNVRQLRARADVFAFDLALGAGYWRRSPGSVHVAVRWNEPGELADEAVGELFSLYVVGPDGKIAATARGTPQDISTAQSVDLDAPADGRYEALVVPERVRGRDYDGAVTLQPKPSGDLLPDLVPRQPTNFSFRVGDRSCLEIEVEGNPGLERCLRFDAVISNIGRGPFATESDITEVMDNRAASARSGAEPEGDAVQILVDADGKEERVETGRWVIDKEHAHTHLVDLAAFELYRVSDDERGRPLVTDVKIGFCPWDLIDERFGRRDGTGRVYPAYACRVPERREGTEPVVLKIGISAGWADVYPARRSIQYLDASDLDDGVYDVVLRVDPNGWYREADTSNNEQTTRIRLNGDTITCVPEPYGCPAHFTPEPAS